MPGSVIVKGSGGAGLGDRIRAVLMGIALAKLTDRELFVDWMDGRFGPRGLNVFSELFAVRGLPIAASLPTSGSISPAAWQGNLALSMTELYDKDGCPAWNHWAAIERYSTDLSTVRHSEDVLVVLDYLQFGKLRQGLESKLGISQKLGELQAQSLLLQKHLRLQPTLSAVIDHFVERHFQRRPVIGVHVRLTQEAVTQKGSVALPRYFAAVDKISQGNSQTTIFLSTDNANVENAFKSHYPNCVTRAKWFARPGDPLHLNPSCPDTLQHAQDAIVEMFLLARCDYLLHGGNSSFSLVSAMAAKLPPDREKILSPDRVAFLRRLLLAGKRMMARFGLRI